MFFCAVIASIVLSDPTVVAAPTGAWALPPQVCVRTSCGEALAEIGMSPGGDWQVFGCLDEGSLPVVQCIRGAAPSNATRDLLHCVVCASCQPGI